MAFSAGVTMGCGPRAPDLGALYARSVGEAARNPVVVIHGFLGARISEAESQDEGYLEPGKWPGDEGVPVARTRTTLP